MSADQWWFARRDEAVGPVSYDELQRLQSNNELKPDTLVWSQGMDAWRSAGEATVLFGSPPAAKKPATNETQEPIHSAKSSRAFGLATKPTSEREAKQAVRAGTVAGYVFAAMQ